MKKIKIRKLKVLLVAVLLFMITGLGITVMGNEFNGWLDWDGSDELAKSLTLITDLTDTVTVLYNEAVAIEAQIDAWVLDLGLTPIELDLNGDGEVTLAEKIAVLEALSSSSAGGLQALQLEIAALEQLVIDINADLDDIIVTEGLTVNGTETELEKIAIINNYIVSLQLQITDLNAEINWLEIELENANIEATQFENDVCDQIRLLPPGIYNGSDYETLCPTP